MLWLDAAGWELLMVKQFYFWSAFWSVCAEAYVQLAFRESGVSKSDTGIFLAVRNCVGLVGSLLLPSLADCIGGSAHGWILRIIVGLMLVSHGLFAWSSLYAPAFVAVAVSCLYRSFQAALGPLVTRSIMGTLAKQDVPATAVGRQRLWGAVGFGMGALAIGLLLEYWDELLHGDVRRLFFVWLFPASIMTLVAWFGLDTSQSAFQASKSGLGADQGDDAAIDEPFLELVDGDGVRAPPPSSFFARLWAVMSARVFFFFLAIYVMGVSMGFVINVLFQYLKYDLHASSLTLGLSIVVTNVAEVPFFLFAEVILRRLGPRGVLLLAQVCMVIRQSFYPQLVWLGDPRWVFAVEWLHGITFSLMWVATMAYAEHVAPKNLKSTMLGLTSGLYGLAGVASGQLVSGFLYQSFGAPIAFYCMAGVQLLATIIFALSMCFDR